MLIKDVMTKEPITLGVDDFIIDAIKVFKENKINGAPVLKGEKFAGLLTNEHVLDFMEVHEFGSKLVLPAPFDFLEAVVNMDAEIREVKREFDRIKKSSVGAIMNRKPVTVSVEMHVSEAADLMTENHLTHLPVLDGKKLVGLVTRSDLVKSLI